MEKYLFYDLEYASSLGGKQKICEFGYVLTNENFDIIETNEIMIDPHISIKEWYRDGAIDNVLNFSINEYVSHLDFSFAYDKISDLFKSCKLAIGYQNSNDAEALNNECKRYGLSFIEHNFIDLTNIYKILNKKNSNPTLEKAMEEYNLKPEITLHIAQNDALCTLKLFKKILENFNTSISNLCEQNNELLDFSKNGKVNSIEISRQRRINLLKDLFAGQKTKIKESKKNGLYLVVLDNVHIDNNQTSPLNGKKICVSAWFEEDNFKTVVNFIQILAKFGAIFTRTIKECDYFIQSEKRDENGNIVYCRRYLFMQNNIDEYKNIKIVTLEEILKMMNLTLDHFNSMEIMSDIFFDKHTKIRRSKIAKLLKLYKGNEDESIINQKPIDPVDEDNPFERMKRILFNKK